MPACAWRPAGSHGTPVYRRDRRYAQLTDKTRKMNIYGYVQDREEEQE